MKPLASSLVIFFSSTRKRAPFRRGKREKTNTSSSVILGSIRNQIFRCVSICQSSSFPPIGPSTLCHFLFCSRSFRSINYRWWLSCNDQLVNTFITAYEWRVLSVDGTTPRNKTRAFLFVFICLLVMCFQTASNLKQRQKYGRRKKR